MRVFVLGVLGALVGCSHHDLRPAAPITPPARLCATTEPAKACRSAADIERLLAGPDLQILGMTSTPSGLQGAKVLTLQGNLDGRSVTFRVKWRAQSTADVINEPRKELAAYAVQKLFLDDHELAAPPTAAYCFPLADYQQFVPDVKRNFRSVDCVFGFATYWLEGVKDVESAREDGWLSKRNTSGFWDPQLFERDAMYRASLSKCNLLTHIINHGDAHDNQLLFEQTPRGLRAYVVDNSVAFLSIKNPTMLFTEDWSKIQVPSLPQQSIARLKNLTQRDLAHLRTIQRLELRNRRLTTQQPAATDAAGDGEGIWWSDKTLRIGLTESEIELVWSRIRELLARPDLEKLTHGAARAASAPAR
jgi:hypothetical protein